MELKTILLTINDGIALVTINRPKAMNAINDDVMTELGYLFTEGLNPKNLKGVIITGAGDKAFVAGADITQFLKLDRDGGYALSKKGHIVYNTIENYSIPVIAAINGYSLGGGNELAMACHIRIASPNAKFGQPEVNLGIVTGYGGTQRLVQYLGKGRALEMLLTGDMIDAEKALSYGLITHVVESESLIDKASKIINKIATKGPISVANTIALVNAFFDKNENAYEKEMNYFGDAIVSEETKEGVTAFLEKRKANFKGN
ncbi:MAG: enoyl-CoA hydratase [Saprospiraceae bacterium]|nr:enoyl-CoA hydratase [Saprospiraceae bacterium]